MRQKSPEELTEFYGGGVSGGLLALVHRICRAERGYTMPQDLVMSEWVSPDSYHIPLAINNFGRELSNQTFCVNSFKLRLYDEGLDVKLGPFTGTNLSMGEAVKSQAYRTVNLDDDPHSRYILEQAMASFEEHDHRNVCQLLTPLGSTVPRSAGQPPQADLIWVDKTNKPRYYT